MESAHQQRNHSARILLLTFACHILFSHPTLPFQGVKVSASERTTTYGVLTSKGTTCLTTLSPALPMLGGECIAAHSNVRSAHQQRDLPSRTLLLAFATHILFSLPPLPFQGAVVTASGEQHCVECTPAKEPPCHHTLTHIRRSHPRGPPSPSLPWLGGECIAALSSVWSAH
ncbi:unnamed protein product [Closterium sp. Yama58-4]|nr:unnamed protein product [Closterium sp. Yama58-4]CAI5483726.1 unnamed protein product [Closterium sp. Yama58-4]